MQLARYTLLKEATKKFHRRCHEATYSNFTIYLFNHLLTWGRQTELDRLGGTISSTSKPKSF